MCVVWSKIIFTSWLWTLLSTLPLPDEKHCCHPIFNFWVWYFFGSSTMLVLVFTCWYLPILTLLVKGYCLVPILIRITLRPCDNLLYNFWNTFEWSLLWCRQSAAEKCAIRSIQHYSHADPLCLALLPAV